MSRIRTNLITNRMANGAPTVSNGLVISGVTTSTNVSVASSVTATTYYGSGANLTNITSTTINNYASTRIVTATNNANELDAETNLTVNGSLITFADSTLVVNKGTNPTVTVTETAGSKSGQFRANTDGALLRSLGNYPLIFHTNQVERAQIDGTGRFLIGTNSVYNANSYSNNLVIYENGDTGASIIGNNSNSNYSSLYFSDTSTASRAFLEVQLGANGNFTIGTNGSGPIRLNNSGGERLRIDGNGRLLLGTTTEGQDDADNLTIDGSGEGTGRTGITIRSASNTFGSIFFSDATSTAAEYDGVVAYDHSTQTMRFSTASTQRVFINSNGYVTMPYQPSFSAHRSSNNWDVSNGSVLPWDQTRHNTGGHFNTSNHRFTAPITGTYLFTFYSIYNTDLSNNNGAVAIRVNGSAPGQGTRCHFTKTGSNWDHVSYSVRYYLNANDYVDIINDGGQTIRYHGGQWSSFTGELVS